jgi:peptidyl-prolyl cis-trans isomerase C
MGLRINGEVASDERFYREFLRVSGGRTPQQMQQVSPEEFAEVQQAAERNVIRAVLLCQLARREGIAVTAEETEQERRAAWGSAANQSCGVGVHEDMAESALCSKAERHLTRHVPRPGRQEVESFYRSRPSLFMLPERWLVSHIVRLAESESERVAAREVLERAAEDLRRGKAFSAVADRYSDCRGNGGSLGWIERGSMVEEFEAAVFALEKRKASAVFETPFGLHIGLLADHKPSGLQPLEDVRTELARRMFEDRRRALVEQSLMGMYRDAQIETVHEPERSVAAGEKVQ